MPRIKCIDYYKNSPFPNDIFNGFGINTAPSLIAINFYPKNFGIPFHNGWDRSRGCGSIFVCPFKNGGVCVYEADLTEEQDIRKGYGIYILSNDKNIRGNKVVFIIWHNKQNLVSLGQKVSMGEPIALEGNTGQIKGAGPDGLLTEEQRALGFGCHSHVGAFEVKEILDDDAFGYESDRLFLDKKYRIIDYNNGYHGFKDLNELLEFEFILKIVPSPNLYLLPKSKETTQETINRIQLALNWIRNRINQLFGK